MTKSATAIPFRTAYGPHLRVDLAFTKPSRTKQSFQAECDINGILARYEKTGVLTHTKQNQPLYTNLVGHTDYHTSLNQVVAAQEAFASLPGKLRSRFGNDPAQFLEFCSNPKNGQEMIDLGLLIPRPDLAPDGPRPTDSAVGPSGASAPSSARKNSTPPAAPKKADSAPSE